MSDPNANLENGFGVVDAEAEENALDVAFELLDTALENPENNPALVCFEADESLAASCNFCILEIGFLIGRDEISTELSLVPGKLLFSESPSLSSSS